MPSEALFASPGWVDAGLEKGSLRMCVVGLGRIGLPTAAKFAMSGARVTGLDIDQGVVESVRAGKCHIIDEPGLDVAVAESVRRGSLNATTVFGEAIPESDFVIICVPTPVDESKVPDYSAVRSASTAIGAALQRGVIVIVESTVGPGTVEEVIQPILEKESGLRSGKDFGVAELPGAL